MSRKAGKAETGSHTSGMSSVSPKEAKEEVEHPMPAGLSHWWQGPCMSDDPEVSKGVVSP